MKKAIKVICGIVAACVIAGGGYVCGSRAGYISGKDSQLSAMPKKSEDISQTAPPQNAPESTPEAKEQEPTPQPKDVRVIKKQTSSSADSSWTTVDHTYNTDGLGTVTLYTSAEKSGDEIIWDDGQKWIVEISDGNGGYYTLYDQYVSNGSVYYDVVKKDNDEKNINVYTMTNAGTTIEQYSYTDSGYEEKEVYNSGAVNRVYSNMPQYE